MVATREVNLCPRYVQGGHSGCDKPPVDIKTKVPFYTVFVHRPHTKTELLFWCQRLVCHNLNGHPVHLYLWKEIARIENISHCSQRWGLCGLSSDRKILRRPYPHPGANAEHPQLRMDQVRDSANIRIGKCYSCIFFTSKVRDGRLGAESRFPDELHDVGVSLRWHLQGGPWNCSGNTDIPAYSDTLGTSKKCHCKQVSL